MPQQQPRKQPKKPKKPRSSKPITEEKAEATSSAQQSPLIRQAESIANNPLLSPPISSNIPESSSPKLSATPSKDDHSTINNDESKAIEEISRLANTTGHLDFSKQCHSTKFGYACTHIAWQQNPKITHVSPCEVSNHTSRCENLAKSTKQRVSSRACRECRKLFKNENESDADRREAVMRRISELENVRRTQVSRAPTSPILAAVGFKHTLASLASNNTQAQATSSVVSDWGLDEAPPFQALNAPTIPGKRPGEIVHEQPFDLSVSDQSKAKVTAGSSSAQQKEHSPADSLKFDSDFEFEADDTNSEDYGIRKDREFWMTQPSAENAGGIPDKPSGLFGKLYNTLTWKKNKSVGEEKEKEDEALKKKKKAESDEKCLTAAEEEYVHVPTRDQGW
jgi:hypothetical protein